MENSFQYIKYIIDFTTTSISGVKGLSLSSPLFNLKKNGEITMENEDNGKK